MNLQKSETEFNKTIAVIDIGAHSIRMEIAQAAESGKYSTLEALSVAVPIGRDVFTKGKIGAANLNLIVKILKDFVHKIKEYDISSFRVVATSAVREALNKDIFTDRIRYECGMEVEVLDSSEEIRLIYLSLKNLLGKRLNKEDNTLIAIIGTGSSHLCLLQKGIMKKAESFRMGTIRLYEETGQSMNKGMEVIDDIVDSVFDFLTESFFSCRLDSVIVVGAAPRALASIRKNAELGEVEMLGKDDFFKIWKDLSNISVEGIVEKYKISDLSATSILPCCEIFEHLFQMSGVSSLMIPETNTRDAIFEEMSRTQKNLPDSFADEIISCADYLGQKFIYDKEHADMVAKYALEIFDAMKKIHGVDEKGRLLLHAAAILHDIGQFLNNRQHHKHSYYLIKNSQLPGISQDELNIIAAIARYHRRAVPRDSHPEYMQLDAPSRVLVSKMAAIIRVADALDRSHNAKFAKLNISFEKDSMLINAESKNFDTTSEYLALDSKSDLFIDIYGMKPKLV
jgi:exopolyphosphatase/guanosine-5'-triphosphate,3'-diphosphate pyrophosphatase